MDAVELDEWRPTVFEIREVRFTDEGRNIPIVDLVRHVSPTREQVWRLTLDELRELVDVAGVRLHRADGS